MFRARWLDISGQFILFVFGSPTSHALVGGQARMGRWRGGLNAAQQLVAGLGRTLHGGKCVDGRGL